MLIFISYKYEDLDYANALDGLLKNPNNKYRHSTDREKKDLRQKGEKAWKNYIKNKLKNCDAIICLIGQNTHNSTGVNYELAVSKSLSIKIIPVRIPDTNGGAPRIIRKRKTLKWDANEINNELSR
jgi:hypothetical protein